MFFMYYSGYICVCVVKIVIIYQNLIRYTSSLVQCHAHVIMKKVLVTCKDQLSFTFWQVGFVGVSKLDHYISLSLLIGPSYL